MARRGVLKMQALFLDEATFCLCTTEVAFEVGRTDLLKTAIAGYDSRALLSSNVTVRHDVQMNEHGCTCRDFHFTVNHFFM